MGTRGPQTELSPEALGTSRDVQRIHLEAVEGAEGSHVSTSDRCTVGSHPSNDFVIHAPTVSRFHCEVRLGDGGARVVDLESRNGTTVDGVRVNDAWLRDGSVLRLGRVEVRARLGVDTTPVRLSPSSRFGGLVGASTAMRGAYAVLERAARSDSTLLIEGETGTGKEEAARAVHEASERHERPFVVVDCSAISASLVESELFGHVRGSFTGAQTDRRGAFEAADGGTVFLDEIGELPLDLQPKLLRVLERRAVTPVGSGTSRDVDVRIVAATNRDLRSEVNAGRFRSDLYFRLAVVRVELPPLRRRPEDIPAIAMQLLSFLGADAGAIASLTSPEVLADLARAAWPGNVRELRNHLERCVLMQEPLPPLAPRAAGAESGSEPSFLDPRFSYSEARAAAVTSFERRYLEALLARHGGNVSAAARAAGMHRVYLHELIRRHGLRT